RGVRHAAGLCDLPRGGSALRRVHRPAVRIPAAHRGGTVGSGCRAGRRSPARDRCAGDRARVRHLARDVLLDQRLAHGRRVHGRICGLLCARAACGRQRAPSILPVLHLLAERLGAAVVLYAAFALFYLGVPLAWRRNGQVMHPRWGGGALLIASLALLLFLAGGPQAAASLWGLALLLAIVDAGLFIESASGAMPLLSAVGAVLSWIVLAVWWDNAAAVVGVLPSLLVLVGLTLVMLGGHAWAHAMSTRAEAPLAEPPFSFRYGVYLALVGQFFLFFVAQNPQWAAPPWPLFGALAVMTLA